MGVHESSKSRSKLVLIKGLFVRVHPNHLVVSFGPLAKSWPIVWRRLKISGIEVAIPKSRNFSIWVETDLETFRSALKSRKLRSKVNSRLVFAACSGIAVLAAGSLFPMGSEAQPLRVKTKATTECSLSQLQRSIVGDQENENVRFLTATEFGGVYSGEIDCKGARYSYTLESKGLERVLKVRKLDT